MKTDVIAAAATPVGGAIAVIRMSGAESLDILKKVFSKDVPFEHAKMYHGSIISGGEMIDEVMAAYFAAPESYTGENSAEIYAHGSPQGVSAILEALLEAGARAARPGDFTKRAFLNGKLDLSQSEAVCDFIGAQSKKGAMAAQSQLQGALKRDIVRFQDTLSDILAAIEAVIEYPEDDLETDITVTAGEKIARLATDIESLKSTYRDGKIIKEGLAVTIAGSTNVGKSSLLNALCGEERAIVTDTPGTTRDTVSQSINVGGVMIKLTDTAGIRETSDEIEKIGVKRSMWSMEVAPLVLLVIDSGIGITAADKEIFDRIDNNVLLVLNKQDLPPKVMEKDIKDAFGDIQVVRVCAKTGVGIELLKQEMKKFATEDENLSQGSIITSARHFSALLRAYASLQSAVDALKAGADLDCVTIDLRQAWDALGEITGKTVSEEIIDRIFAKFCLGK